MMNKNKRKILFLFIIMGFLFSAQISHAMTEISLTKNIDEVFTGDIFSADLKISSVNKSINVVDGTILYDKDKLEIKKINKEDSIFSLWTKEPVFDNKKGELSFTTGIPNGFDGKDGEILNITFLAKKSGKTLISFQDIFYVFANDGKGTQINPWLKPLLIEISAKSFLKNIFDYSIKTNMNYNYLLVFLLIILFIIIKVFLLWKNNRREK